MAQVINSPISPTSLGWDTVMQGLDKLTMKEARNIKDFIPMLFTDYGSWPSGVKKITRKVYSGMEDAQPWSNETASTFPLASIAEMFDITAQQAWYANAVQYTQDMKTFDPNGIKGQMATSLGVSGRRKRQKLGVNFFNTGFATSGHPWNAVESGVAFFSAGHTTDPRLGTTQCNLVTGTQSVATFMSAIDYIINCRDYLGNPLDLLPKRLYVYPTKVAQAKEYLGVGMHGKAGEISNNRNPFSDFTINVVGCPWFSSETMWLMQADKTSTYYHEAVGVSTTKAELPNMATEHRLYFALAFWADDWRGWVGGAG